MTDQDTLLATIATFPHPTSADLRTACALVPLGPWLERCAAGRVPCVPASFSPPFPLKQLWTTPDGAPTPELKLARAWLTIALAEAKANGHPRAYVRWEDCSPEASKHRLAHGGGWHPNYAHLPTLDDCRLQDCAVTDPQRLCLRPWVQALQIDGYPLEFRAYFGPHGCLGISNYHPQRPLNGGTLALQRWIDDALAAAAQLHDPRRDTIGFTADFVVDVTGRVLFLEGGPPHVPSGIGPSAHPCCFAPGRISGVALGPQHGALTH